MSDLYYANVYDSSDVYQEVNNALEEIKETVTSTLGPGAGYVFMTNAVIGGGPLVTKDGVTVSAHLKYKDPLRNAVSMLINDAAKNAVRLAGDGTTTCTLLACELSLRIRKLIESHMTKNGEKMLVRRVADDLDALLKETLTQLDKMVLEVDSEEKLLDVARIACDGQEDIAKIVSSAVWKVGRDGQVSAKASADEDMKLRYESGYIFNDDRVLVCYDERFIVDKKKGQTVLQNPYVIIVDDEMDDIDSAWTVIDAYMQLKKVNDAKGEKTGALVLICSDIFGAALSTIIKNLNSAPIFLVKCPDFNARREALLGDIAWLTDTHRVFNAKKGNPLETFGEDFRVDAEKQRYSDMPWGEFGQAKEITIKKHSCIIKHGKSSEVVAARVNDLKEAMSNTESQEERAFYSERISKLIGGIATIFIGAHSNTETRNKADFVDDAVRSCFCALRDGIIPGAGVALKEVVLSDVDVHYRPLIDEFHSAAMAPYKKIRENLELDIYEDYNHESKEDFDSIYDPVNREWVDGLKAGIIDPVLVTKTAIITAVSAAKQLIATRKFIISKDE